MKSTPPLQQQSHRSTKSVPQLDTIDVNQNNHDQQMQNPYNFYNDINNNTNGNTLSHKHHLRAGNRKLMPTRHMTPQQQLSRVNAAAAAYSKKSIGKRSKISVPLNLSLESNPTVTINIENYVEDLSQSVNNAAEDQLTSVLFENKNNSD